MKRTPRTPSYRHHKGSDQGFVELDGRRIYLGKWGLPETEQRYHRTVAEWIANGRHVAIPPEDITVKEMIARYWTHCTAVYVSPDGAPTPYLEEDIKLALAPLRRLYGDVNAVDFGPKALRVLQEQWANQALACTSVNRRVRAIRRAFRWAAAHEIIPVMVAHGLDMVEGVKAGTSGARESKHIGPVSDEHVDAIRDFVSPVVWGLIQLQRLTGARSGELIELRPCDVDRSGGVWMATLERHKTAHHGHTRVLHFGPQAQAILRPYLLRPADAYMFDPHDAVAWRASRFPTHRRSNQKADPNESDRTVNHCYTVDSYRRAIARACIEANVPDWHPHQLRHSLATRVRAEYGLEAAQVVLGHARANITQVYAEANQAKAAEVAAKIG
jgi:integrase